MEYNIHWVRFVVPPCFYISPERTLLASSAGEAEASGDAWVFLERVPQETRHKATTHCRNERNENLPVYPLLMASRLFSLTRHYFVSSPYLASNPGEQFYMFTIIAAWLINMAGRPFTEPQEYDEPNATVSNILAELRSFVSDILPALLLVVSQSVCSLDRVVFSYWSYFCRDPVIGTQVPTDVKVLSEVFICRKPANVVITYVTQT